MILIPVAAMFGLPAWQQSDAADWRDWPTHESRGLRFAVPPDMTVVESENAFELSTPVYRRRIDTITLYAPNPPSQIGHPKSVLIVTGDHPTPHAVMERVSGSGGTEYELITHKTVDGQNVGVLAITQSEWGVPDFDDAWAVLDSLSAAD